MALEPAGVSLQAENFNKYIKQLGTIDKAQQDIFDVDSNDLTKAFGSATKSADKYERELKQVQKAQQQTQRSQQQLSKSLTNFSGGLTAAAGGLAAFATGASVQFAAESAKIAAQFQGQQIGLRNLAASFGQSGAEIQASIQTASKGTISGLDAIQAANTALLFGVAKTPEEFATLTDSALTLGRTLGLDATQSIEQFTTALGRQSLLILDNFGISAKQVNAEIERLARADFGKARSELTEAQKQATFMKAALNIAGEAAATIGDEAGNAQAAFDRLTASSENLKVTFGALVGPLGTGIANALAKAAKTAQQFFAFLGAGFSATASIAKSAFGNIVASAKDAALRTKLLFTEGLEAALQPATEEFKREFKTLDDILDEAGVAAIDRFKEIASTIEGVSFDKEKLVTPIEEQADAVDEATQNLEAYQSAIQQAEQLQLSFARSAEDSALKLARANEDIARKQAQSVAKLQERQTKDRDKLLQSQAKQLDNFEKDRRKQIAKAESNIRKARQEAGEQRKRDQRKLQRELQQAQERFNLSRLQSERRFSLQESRLRAEGDILGLKELREDFALTQKEEKENFDLSKKEQVSSAKETQKEQDKDLSKKLKELKINLENQRADLLSSFDQQLIDQQASQAIARAEQQRGFEEAAAERSIQLAREEEDRRISQRRQLEDLGRSLAEQQGVTAEGSAAIAAELEKVFGIGGVADNIMTGFTTKTESDFASLFKDLEKTVSDAKIEPEPLGIPTTTRTAGVPGGGRIGGIPEFNEGGVVPGPIGSPQMVMAHGGETFLPTHQRSMQMAAPIIPSQNLNVSMSGGFNITGDGQSNDAILQAAAQEMTENFRIAVQRLARRN